MVDVRKIRILGDNQCQLRVSYGPFSPFVDGKLTEAKYTPRPTVSPAMMVAVSTPAPSVTPWKHRRELFWVSST